MSEQVSYRQIMADIAAKHGVTVAAIYGPSGERRRVVPARQETYAVLRERGWSYPKIGALLARDHTTVIYGVRAHKARAGNG